MAHGLFRVNWHGSTGAIESAGSPLSETLWDIAAIILNSRSCGKLHGKMLFRAFCGKLREILREICCNGMGFLRAAREYGKCREGRHGLVDSGCGDSNFRSNLLLSVTRELRVGEQAWRRRKAV
ncbi:hypothetical protein [Sphingomonas sp. UYAg733]